MAPRDQLPRSTTPGSAPPDWQTRWQEPLEWPAPANAPPRDLAAQTKAHQEWQPTFDNAALIIIDVDKKSFDQTIAGCRRGDAQKGDWLAQHTYQTVLPNLVRVLEWFRAQRKCVIHVYWHWHRYPYPPLEPRSGEEIVIKRTRGAFASSALDTLLRQHHIQTCYFTGADLGVCVSSTVRGAIDLGYRTALIEDACMCADPLVRTAALTTLGWQQTHVLTTARLLGC